MLSTGSGAVFQQLWEYSTLIILGSRCRWNVGKNSRLERLRARAVRDCL